ncbi:uncharacterized protein LOC125671274 isoform X2 [Ostrea edulis]|uniref:uncharacterized protein LOC125671274 isoform X2 n=1 Tax=Ostrea edulis TaxID=37623 RepID=UPI0024AF3605|nr:uncharacterized protein LOC125671274 isoform X2 [Ostrea edulis]
MDRLTSFTILLFLLVLQTADLEAKKCTKKTLYYAAQHYCSSTFLWWCNSYGYRRITVYQWTSVCCPGYVGSDCETPICNPPCANGGTCVSPNTCSCPSIVGGASCQEIVTCSHLKPCFPGNCSGTSCSCDGGFSGDACLQFDKTRTAKINSLNTTLMNVKRSDGRQLYEFNADAFSNFQSIWVDRKDYNYFLIYFEALFSPEIPYPPSYIHEHGIGIVSAYARVVQSKIGRAGGEAIDVSLNTTLSCPGTYNDTSPSNEPVKCNISYDQFNRIIEDGDNLKILAVAEVGGYRNVWNQTHFVRREIYHRAMSEKSINIMFDFSKPKHCLQSNNCTTQLLPMKIPNDASKDPFTFDVDGWRDIPSGIKKYSLEVHKLKKKLHSDTLTEEAPMDPFYHEERNISSLPFSEFTPPDSGIYSFILQVTDKANNSEFARQIAIYDPNSTISITAESNLFVSTAEGLSNYSWQSECLTVQVTWNDYFINSFHLENHLLLPIEPFPIQLRGGNIEELKSEIVKDVKDDYDDHYGKRTVSAVKHVNGITEFEVYYTYIAYSNSSTSNNTHHFNETSTTDVTTTEATVQTTGTESSNDTLLSTVYPENSNDTFLSTVYPENPNETDYSTTVVTTSQGTTTRPCLSATNSGNMENQWIKIANITHGKYTLEHEWKDGDSMNISIRARDITNNTRTASRRVNFDASPPTSSDAIFTKNVGNRTHEYSSSVRITASDVHSGIRLVQWRLKDKNKQNEIYKEGYFRNNPVQLSDCSTSDGCYCLPMGECYKKNMEFDFDNCWLAISKPLLSNASFILEIEAFNQAMLAWNVTYHELSSLTSFDGIDGGDGIRNLNRESFADGFRFTWENVPSCYKASYITIFVYVDCDKSKPPQEVTLPTDKTEYTLSNLEAGKEYCIDVVSNNTGVKQQLLETWTVETPTAIPVAMIAAVSAVIAILLGIILIFVLLWRNGHLNAETKRRLTMYLKRPVTMMMGKRKTGFYSGRFQDEDIYDFGQMVFSENEGWLYTFDDISLKGKLKSGDFADIYLAELCQKDTAIAKILKEDYTQEDRLVLQAKISFFATEVPPHENIIHFLGSVLNHPIFGPYMLLEYCELGQLREWLIDHRNKVTDELITDFCKMVHGIAKGMEALEQKEIVHRRLATRNILLTSRLVPRVAGFGPTPEEGKNEVNKERRPIKWLAPECYESMKNCTSMSDVWAFGVVIWEIFSTGQNPYPGIDAKTIPMRVKNGYRMSTPEFCPETNGILMEHCWESNPKDRPTFSHVVTTLDSYYDARYPCDFEAMDTV